MSEINKLLHYISTTRKLVFVSPTIIIVSIVSVIFFIIFIARSITKGNNTSIEDKPPSLKHSKLSQNIDSQTKINTKNDPRLSEAESSTKSSKKLQITPAIIQSNESRNHTQTPSTHIQSNLGQYTATTTTPQHIGENPPPQSEQLNVVDTKIAEQVHDCQNNVIIPKFDFSEANNVNPKQTSFKGKIKKYKNNQLIEELIKNDNNDDIRKKYDNNGNAKIFIDTNEYTSISPGKALLSSKKKLIYKGNFNDDYQYHGEGILMLNNDIIKGTFNNGCLEKGEIFYDNGNCFEGKFRGTNTNPEFLHKFGTVKNNTHNSNNLHIRDNCIFEQDPTDPNKGKLYTVASKDFYGQKTLFFEGIFYEDDLNNNKFPYPKEGIFYYSNGSKKFEGKYDINTRTYEGTLYNGSGSKKFTGTFNAEFEIIKGKKYNNQGNLVFDGTFFGDESFKKGIRYNGNGPDDTSSTKIDNQETYFLKKPNLKIIEAQPPENIHLQEDEIYGKIEYSNNSYTEGIFKNGNFVDIKTVTPTEKQEGKYFKENNTRYFKGTVETNDKKIEGLFAVLDNDKLKNYKNDITNKNTNEKYLVINEYIIYEIKDKNGNIIDNVNNIRNDEVYDVKSGSLESENNIRDTYLYYEGEMVNEKKHGKGRLYRKTFENTLVDIPRTPLQVDNTNIVMEGTFYNDMLHGEGKRINYNYKEKGYFEFDTLINGTMTFPDNFYSDVKFESQAFSQITNGTVKEYNKNGRLIQTIEYNNNVATIKAPNNIIIFTGEYNYITKTRVNGTGKEYKKNEDGTYDINHLVFDGEYKNRKRIGTMFNSSDNFFNILWNKRSKPINNVQSDMDLNSSFFKNYKEQKKK